MHNKVLVSGVLTQTETLRYTPAGLAVMMGVIEHQSEQFEAGLPRKIEQAFRCRFMGETAQQASRIALGSPVQVKGFLCGLKKGSMSLVVHAQEIQVKTSHKESGV